ncbi:MAG: helical backbone metal receptor [Brevinematales bacterium]|nr:helical backbone metal receptor [Brevinematales bacterium]
MFVFVVVLVFFNLVCYGNVVDDMGNVFERRNYARIISLAPSITETLVFLGVEDKIVGVTRYCNLNRMKVGGIYDPDFEGIIKLKPDIVFMLKMGTIENYQNLLKRGIRVFVMDYPRFDSLLENMDKLANLVGSRKVRSIYEVRNYVTNLMFKVSNVVKGKSFLVLYSYPLIYTASSNSLVADVIRKIGGINLTDKFSYQYQTLTINVETVLKLSPDVILIAVGENNESISNEIVSLGLKSKIITLDPMDLSPSLRITNLILKIYERFK